VDDNAAADPDHCGSPHHAQDPEEVGHAHDQPPAEGAAGATGAQVFEGYSQMGAFRDAAVAACQPYDYVLSPVSPVPSFPAEWASPINDPARPFEHIAFTLPYNMSEQPAISVHCGFTQAGLPIGLQVAGHRHDDLGVLQVARAWEKLRPAMRAWPM